MAIYQWGTLGSVSLAGSVDTELATPTALTDDMNNPTVPGVASYLMGFDGARWDRLPGSAATGLLVNLTGMVSVDIADLSADALDVEGKGGHGSAVVGNPLLIGFEARTSNPTAVTNGQAVRGMADDLGRQIVVANGVRDLVTQNNITLSNGTETTLLAGGGGGTFLDITRLILSNAGASAVTVSIRDATGGTVRLSVMLAANGGGAVLPFDPPLKQTTAGNNWTAQLGAASGDVRVFAQAVQNV